MVDVAVGARFSLNNVGMIRRLATLDLGIPVVADDIASGALQRVLPDWHATPVPVYAMTETRLLPGKAQRFNEFLRERLPER